MAASSIAIAWAAALLAGCGASLPRPAAAPQPDSAFVEVPYPPPPAVVETVPPRPSPGALWIDGQWSWGSDQWVWSAGGWVAAPPGARFAQWQLRLGADGRLTFAASSWRDAAGREMQGVRVLAAAQGERATEALPGRCQ
jgi:hypothetical protein